MMREELRKQMWCLHHQHVGIRFKNKLFEDNFKIETFKTVTVVPFKS